MWQRFTDAVFEQIDLAPAQKTEPEIRERGAGELDDLDAVLARIEHAKLVNRHSYGSTERLEVLCNSAKEYINLLSVVNASLQGSIPFPKEELSLRYVKVCHFYRDTETLNFIDIGSQQETMLEAMAEVARRYHAMLQQDDKSAWSEYVLRRARTVMLNIDTLSSQMVLGETVN